MAEENAGLLLSVLGFVKYSENIITNMLWFYGQKHFQVSQGVNSHVHWIYQQIWRDVFDSPLSSGIRENLVTLMCLLLMFESKVNNINSKVRVQQCSLSVTDASCSVGWLPIFVPFYPWLSKADMKPCMVILSFLWWKTDVGSYSVTWFCGKVMLFICLFTIVVSLIWQSGCSSKPLLEIYSHYTQLQPSCVLH